MPDSVSDLPYPLLVNALTGEPMPPVSFDRLGALASNGSGPEGRRAPNILGWDPNAGDPNVLGESGWGIIFEADADPAIKARLQPLIDSRANAAQQFFKIFTGNTGATPGVTPGQTAASWIRPLCVSLDTPVDPLNGMPYYLLIVGPPDTITFDFQASLKSQFAVGRLYFDDIEDYGRYAQAMVQYESKSYTPIQSRSAALWVTRNPGDLATAMLSGTISQDFLPPGTPLGTRRNLNFLQNAFVNEKATKARLIEILRGNLPGGPPAVILTGSHGCNYAGADPGTQRRMQGSLMTQEWVPKTPASPANQFCADDIPADARLLGTMGFLFACFSGACPAENNYFLNPDGSPIKVAPQPMISRIPQALLSRGMLAVIAHIDLAFPYAFQDVDGTTHTEAVRSPLEQIMAGSRAGYAADILTSMWNSRAAHLGMAQGMAPAATAPAAAPADPAAARQLAHMTLARDDARNYIVLGDPAAQLRVKDLK